MPKMLKPIELDEMKQFFFALAKDLVQRVNPERKR
jgi:hypothetical protein